MARQFAPREAFQAQTRQSDGFGSFTWQQQGFLASQGKQAGDRSRSERRGDKRFNNKENYGGQHVPYKQHFGHYHSNTAADNHYSRDSQVQGPWKSQHNSAVHQPSHPTPRNEMPFNAYNNNNNNQGWGRPANQPRHPSNGWAAPRDQRVPHCPTNNPACHNGALYNSQPMQASTPSWAAPHSQARARHYAPQHYSHARPAGGPEQRRYNNNYNRRWSHSAMTQQQVPAMGQRQHNIAKPLPALVKAKVILPPASESELKFWRPLQQPDTSLSFNPLPVPPTQAPAEHRFTLEVAPSGKQLSSDTFEVDFVPALPHTSTNRPVCVMGDVVEYAVVPVRGAGGRWALKAVLVGYHWVGSSKEDPLVSASWEIQQAFQAARELAEVDATVVVTLLPGDDLKDE